MFGLGFTEIAIILVVALIVLGPNKLPELARTLGKGLREFRKATDDFKSTIQDEVYKPDSPGRRVDPPPPRLPGAPSGAVADVADAKLEEAPEAPGAIADAQASPPAADVATASPVEADAASASPVEADAATASPVQTDDRAEQVRTPAAPSGPAKKPEASEVDR